LQPWSDRAKRAELQVFPRQLGRLPPGRTTLRRDEQKCRELTAKNEKLFEESKPDIVVIAALWPLSKRLERLENTLGFLKRIGCHELS
jgi:hypothetical protein